MPGKLEEEGMRDFGAGRAIFGADNRGLDLDFPAPQQAPESHEPRPGQETRSFAAVALHSRKKRHTSKSEHDVGDPHAHGGRHNTLPRQARPHNEQQIIRRDDHHREQRACGAPAATGFRPQRYRD